MPLACSMSAVSSINLACSGERIGACKQVKVNSAIVVKVVSVCCSWIVVSRYSSWLVWLDSSEQGYMWICGCCCALTCTGRLFL